MASLERKEITSLVDGSGRLCPGSRSGRCLPEAEGRADTGHRRHGISADLHCL